MGAELDVLFINLPLPHTGELKVALRPVFFLVARFRIRVTSVPLDVIIKMMPRIPSNQIQAPGDAYSQLSVIRHLNIMLYCTIRRYTGLVYRFSLRQFGEMTLFTIESRLARAISQIVSRPYCCDQRFRTTPDVIPLVTSPLEG
jgi:hypothetical protein